MTSHLEVDELKRRYTPCELVRGQGAERLSATRHRHCLQHLPLLAWWLGLLLRIGIGGWIGIGGVGPIERLPEIKAL